MKVPNQPENCESRNPCKEWLALHFLDQVYSRAIKNSKILFYIVTLLNPFIKLLIHIIDFYTVATFQLQYLIPKFIRDYNINSIPRFILVDPEGNIVSADAMRPSDPQIRNYFQELGI